MDAPPSPASVSSSSSSFSLPPYARFAQRHAVLALLLSLLLLLLLALFPLLLPHLLLPLQPAAFLLGLLASLAAYSFRTPFFSIFSPPLILLLPALHELVRAAALYLAFNSLYPSSSPHSYFALSYYFSLAWTLVLLLYENFLLLSNLHLYSDILPPFPPPLLSPFHSHSPSPHHTPPEVSYIPDLPTEASPLLASNLQLPYSTLIDLALRQRDRESLDAALGAPFPHIPVFLFAIWRIDSAILSLLLTFFLSLSLFPSSSIPSYLPFPLAIIIAVIFHSTISYLWALSLPRYGVPIVCYATLLTLLLLLSATLEAWALVL